MQEKYRKIPDVVNFNSAEKMAEAIKLTRFIP